jgi:hypothetical protein
VAALQQELEQGVVSPVMCVFALPVLQTGMAACTGKPPVGLSVNGSRWSEVAGFGARPAG